MSTMHPRTLRTLRTLCTLCTLLLPACNSRTPTAPTPPPAPPPVSPLPPASSVLQISVIGDQWIYTTATPVQMTARLITSTTPLEYVDGSQGVHWSVEPAGIATIDSQGRVTPQALGTARAIATYGEKQSFNPFRVLPGYGGQWSGEFIVTACTGGADPRECGRIMIGEGLRPNRYQFSLDLSQFRDQISGTLHEVRSPGAGGDVVVPVTGLVRLNGTLLLEATVPQPNHEPFRVINWSSVANAAVTTMSGAFTQYEPRSTLLTPPYRYVLRMENEFTNISRVQ